MPTLTESTDVAIIGAGPCGLAAAIAVQRAGMRALTFDRGCLVSGIAGYPTYLTFFSTPAKLEIGGVPFVVAAEKPTRRDALAYYRAVVEHSGLDVRQYEEVIRIEQTGEGGGGGPPPKSSFASSIEIATIQSPPPGPVYRLHTRTACGRERDYSARAAIVATGYFGVPNRLGVPGEDLPHVAHQYREGHYAFRRQAVVVGGGNSAVEAALDLHRAGAHVTLVHFGPTFDRNIKPWVLPDMTNRIGEGGIAARWDSRIEAITATEVILATARGEERIHADHVYLMIGYMPEVELLRDLGVPIDAATGVPAHDPATMETPVPGLFIAGVIASGYDANKTFIENGRFHGDLIARRLVRTIGEPADPSPS